MNIVEMQEIRVQSQEWEDPLEEEIAAHSRVLAWAIPWTEEPGELQSMGSQRVRHIWATDIVFAYPWPGPGKVECPQTYPELAWVVLII